MKNRTALNKMCVDISEKMCYHVFNRRSDLGVVQGNPEFGHKGYAVPYAPLRRFVYPGDCSEKQEIPR